MQGQQVELQIKEVLSKIAEGKIAEVAKAITPRLLEVAIDLKASDEVVMLIILNLNQSSGLPSQIQLKKFDECCQRSPNLQTFAKMFRSEKLEDLLVLAVRLKYRHLITNLLTKYNAEDINNMLGRLVQVIKQDPKSLDPFLLEYITKCLNEGLRRQIISDYDLAVREDIGIASMTTAYKLTDLASALEKSIETHLKTINEYVAELNKRYLAQLSQEQEEKEHKVRETEFETKRLLSEIPSYVVRATTPLPVVQKYPNLIKAINAVNNANKKEVADKLNLVRKELEAGADPNTTDENGEPALILAVRGQNPQLVGMLLDNLAHPANPNVRENGSIDPDNALSAFAIAADSSTFEIAGMLVDHGVIITSLERGNETPLIRALGDHGNAEVIALILFRSPPYDKDNIGSKTEFNLQSNKGSLALYQDLYQMYKNHQLSADELLVYAVKQNFNNLARYLVNHMNDKEINEALIRLTKEINREPNFTIGETRNIHGEIVRNEKPIYSLYTLNQIIQGVEEERKQVAVPAKKTGVFGTFASYIPSWATPIAIGERTKPIRQYVSAVQTSRQVEEPEVKATPLASVVLTNVDARLLDNIIIPNPQGVRSALDNGADPNVRNKDGESALVLAIDSGERSIVSDLLERSASVKVRAVGKEVRGYSPLAVAAASYGSEPLIVASILEHGADVNAQEPDNETALLLAFRNYKLSISVLLLAYGANTQATNVFGETVSSIAQSRLKSQPEYNELLQAYKAEGMVGLFKFAVKNNLANLLPFIVAKMNPNDVNASLIKLAIDHNFMLVVPRLFVRAEQGVITPDLIRLAIDYNYNFKLSWLVGKAKYEDIRPELVEYAVRQRQNKDHNLEFIARNQRYVSQDTLEEALQEHNANNLQRLIEKVDKKLVTLDLVKYAVDHNIPEQSLIPLLRHFITNKGNEVINLDLIKMLMPYELITLLPMLLINMSRYQKFLVINWLAEEIGKGNLLKNAFGEIVDNHGRVLFDSSMVNRFLSDISNTIEAEARQEDRDWLYKNSMAADIYNQGFSLLDKISHDRTRIMIYAHTITENLKTVTDYLRGVKKLGEPVAVEDVMGTTNRYLKVPVIKPVKETDVKKKEDTYQGRQRTPRFGLSPVRLADESEYKVGRDTLSEKPQKPDEEEYETVKGVNVSTVPKPKIKYQ